MRIRPPPTDGRPLYVQTRDEVRRGLLRGTLGPDDLLLSVRELASELQVNPRTVSQAYAELEREGLVHVRHGRRRAAIRSSSPRPFRDASAMARLANSRASRGRSHRSG